MTPEARADFTQFIATYNDIVNRVATLSESYLPTWDGKRGRGADAWRADWAQFRAGFDGRIVGFASALQAEKDDGKSVSSTLNDAYFGVFQALRAGNPRQSPSTLGSLSNLYARLLGSDPRKGDPELFGGITLPERVDCEDVRVLQKVSPATLVGVPDAAREVLPALPEPERPRAAASKPKGGHKLLYVAGGGLAVALALAYVARPREAKSL